MGKKLIAIEAPEPYLAITWQVNNFCNYQCSYCNPGNWGGTDRNEGNLAAKYQAKPATIALIKRKGISWVLTPVPVS